MGFNIMLYIWYFYSYDGYTTFLGWLMIPAQWLKSATAGLIGEMQTVLEIKLQMLLIL